MALGVIRVALAITVFLLVLPALAQSGGLTYSRVNPQGPQPSGRIDAPIACDAPGRRLLMFGGQDSAARNDLWAFSLDRQDWTELNPPGARPPARFGHTATFDPVRRRLVIFGGQDSGFFSDVWAYDIIRNTWQLLSPDEAGPSRRYGHSAIYEAARDRLVISHGFTTSGRFDDTWAFSLATNTWQNLSPAGTRPLKRCLHHAVYDERNGQMLLYGGCASGFGPCPLDDLWSFDLSANRWTQRTGTPQPPPRQWYGLAFDGLPQRLILFGGLGNGGALDDTWEYDPSANAWAQRSPGGERPAARSRHQATFVADLGAMVFFGGRTTAGLTNELWVLAATPGARPTITAPAGGSRLGLAPPSATPFTWTGVAGALRYGVEHTGAGGQFANPNGTGPDPVNGYGGAGGGFAVDGTSLSITLSPATPPGAYQIRVIGLSATGEAVGSFSDALTVVVQ